LALAQRLWKSPFHEEKSAAIHMLSAFARRLEADHWTVFRKWIGECRSADHCDGIAIELVGGLVKRDRSWCRVLKHWTLSKNAWERRAAVGGVFLRARQMGDVEAALMICEPLMRDPAPAVQEAVGVLLVESRRADPIQTEAFLERWREKGKRAILESVR
jgi:3-methyladenine DNA glycosylase AlkD